MARLWTGSEKNMTPLWADAGGRLRGSRQWGQHKRLQAMNTELSCWTPNHLPTTLGASHYKYITYKSPQPWIEMRHLALVLRERGLTINFTGTKFSTLGPHVVYVYVTGWS